MADLQKLVKLVKLVRGDVDRLEKELSKNNSKEIAKIKKEILKRQEVISSELEK